jgi:lipopolysaccharide transport system permease protein
VLDLVRSVRKNRRLLRDFVVRDLKGRYVGSTMGFFWSIVFPVINLAIYTFVFRLVLNARWSDQQPAAQVVLMMFAGIVVWSAFSETVSRSTNTLVENSNLIQKVVFPSEILPLYLAISSWINMCIGLVFVLLGVAWLGYVDPLAAPTKPPDPGDPPYLELAFGAPLVLLPVLFALQAVLALGLGYFLASLNLFVRDTYHLIGVFLTVWMFATPIFYSAAMVERAGQDGEYAWILDVNPMYWLVDSYRSVLLFAQWPDFALLGRFLLVAVVVFLAGTRFFLSQKRRFPDLL